MLTLNKFLQQNHLYNGYMDESMNPLWMLASLDAVNLILLMNAICLQFNKKTNCYLTCFQCKEQI